MTPCLKRYTIFFHPVITFKNLIFSLLIDFFPNVNLRAERILNFQKNLFKYTSRSLDLQRKHATIKINSSFLAIMIYLQSDPDIPIYSVMPHLGIPNYGSLVGR